MGQYFMQNRPIEINNCLTLDRVEPTNDYHLISTFSNGVVKDFDYNYLF